MDNHAYLILAHDNWNQLAKLIELIDHKNNDIYLHIDKKSTINNGLLNKIKNSAKQSTLVLIDNITVSWGGYSFVEAEMRLLEKAIEIHHSYYHLLSGMDLPIKSQDIIHDFFL